MEVGDYKWHQLSMWDFAPKDCIQVHVKSECGRYVFHYYLLRTTEVINQNRWKTETVTSVDGVPADILHQHGGEVSIRKDGKTTLLTNLLPNRGE